MTDSKWFNYFFVFVISGGLIAAAVTVPACSNGNLHPGTAPAGSETPVSGTFSLCFDAPGGVRSLDLFIYRDTLTRPLECHQRLEGPMPDTITLDSRPGERLLVAVANSPAPFRIEALQRCDGAEQLEMYYRMEDPDFPLMSAVCSFSEGPVKLTLSPLLCRVNIYHIVNFTGQALNNARVQLKGINSHVQMLRSDGFRTIETEDNPSSLSHPEMMLCRIPGEIGEELSTPELTLLCYPFDGEGPNITSLLFTATANGELREWTFPVPSLKRGGSAEMALTLR